ncbi:MAG: CpsD/CapB family tyrosine-protein kinase, partial [bacterium]
DLLQHARNQYGIIIMDCPPLNSVIDSVALSTLSDGVLMVLNSGTVRRGEAQHAKHLLEDVDVQILGTILNQVTQELPGYYSYYSESSPVRSARS